MSDRFPQPENQQPNNQGAQPMPPQQPAPQPQGAQPAPQPVPQQPQGGSVPPQQPQGTPVPPQQSQGSPVQPQPVAQQSPGAPVPPQQPQGVPASPQQPAPQQPQPGYAPPQQPQQGQAPQQQQQPQQPQPGYAPQQPQPGYVPPQPQQPQGYVAPQAGYLPSQTRRHVHHTYIWLSSIQVVFSLIVVAIIMFIPVIMGEGISEISDTIGIIAGSAIAVVGFLVVLVLLVGLTVGLQALSYKYLFYEVGEREFTLYSGILNKKQVHVPYQRIQSVNQRATLLQRIMGVCTVHIETAGGSQNKAVMVPYLQNTEAERLRTELFSRKQIMLAEQKGGAAAAHAVAQAAAAQAAQGSNVLDAPAEILTDVRGVFGGAQIDTGAVRYQYGLSNKELIFTGLSNNTGFAIMVMAIIFSVGGFIAQALESRIGQDLYSQGVAIATRIFAGNVIAAIVVGLLLLMVVIWVISIIGTCISYGGFKATRRQTRIEVEHGLLQHRFHGVDIDRVQSVIIKQTFIRRLIGYCEISLGKIDAATDQSQDEQQQVQLQQGLIVHPFVKMSRVPEILAGLVPEFADVPTEPIKLPKVSLRRGLLRHCLLLSNGLWTIVFVAIIQVVCNWVLPAFDADLGSSLTYINLFAYILYGVGVITLIIEGINTVMWFRGSSYSYNQKFMQITNGGFSRESISFPRKKIQYAFTRVNPFQRRSKVATINVRTAAGIGGTTMKLVDVSEEDAKKWLDWVIPGQSMLK